MDSSRRYQGWHRTVKSWFAYVVLPTGVIGALAVVNDDSPFKVAAALDESSATNLILNVSVKVAEGWKASIPEALDAARAESKPVLINFWASWCKSCEAMDITTLRDKRVRDALRGFIKVKYRADHPNRSPDREVLDRFGVVGRPTYVILKPRLAAPAIVAR